MRGANAVAVACCCCVSCSHDTGGGSFYTAVGTRPAPAPHPHINHFIFAVQFRFFRFFSFLRLCLLCSDGRVLIFEAEEDFAAMSLRHVVSTEAAGAVISLFWNTNFVSTGDKERDVTRWGQRVRATALLCDASQRHVFGCHRSRLAPCHRLHPTAPFWHSVHTVRRISAVAICFMLARGGNMLGGRGGGAATCMRNEDHSPSDSTLQPCHPSAA